MAEEFSDEALAAFLAEETRIRLTGEGHPVAATAGVLNYEMEALWARVRDTERRLTRVEARETWLLGLLLALGIALGMTELSLAIQSLS